MASVARPSIFEAHSARPNECMRPWFAMDNLIRNKQGLTHRRYKHKSLELNNWYE